MRGRHAAIAAMMLLAGAPAARAQGAAAPVSRADLSFSVGWFNADKSEPGSYRGRNDWYNRSLYGGAGFGWYWTDHLKTEIDGGVTTGADLFVYTPTVVEARQATLYSTYTFGTQAVRYQPAVSVLSKRLVSPVREWWPRSDVGTHASRGRNLPAATLSCDSRPTRGPSSSPGLLPRSVSRRTSRRGRSSGRT